MEKFKSLYKDGLVPTKEFHDVAKNAGENINSLFKKYIDEGYSPREITELLHNIVSAVGADKCLLLTVKRHAEHKKALTKPPTEV